MYKFIFTSLLFILFSLGLSSVASAKERPSHFPNERHVLAEELKEDIQELKDLVRDIRDVLREIRKR